MPGPAPLFREVHRLRLFIHDLEEQLNRFPRQLKAHQAKVARAEQTQREELEAIKKLKLTAADKEKTIKSKQTQVARYEQQINDVSSKKEYDALQLEISHGKQEWGQLEDEVLTALMEVDERTARLPDREKAVQQAKKDLATFEAEASKRREALTGELEKAKKELAAVEVDIDEDLLPQYKRTILSLGPDGMAAVRARICTACQMEITRQSQTELEREAFVMCASCGRILYLPADAEPSRYREDSDSSD